MSTNSIRIDAGLFNEAREQGLIMSRSAAQQIEHWVRLGIAIEKSGVSVQKISEMISSEYFDLAVEIKDESEIREEKMAAQRLDIKNVQSGRYTNEQMNCFSGGIAKRSKILNEPY